MCADNIEILCSVCGWPIPEDILREFRTHMCIDCVCKYKVNIQPNAPSTFYPFLNDPYVTPEKWFNMVEIGLEDGEDLEIIKCDAWKAKELIETEMISWIDSDHEDETICPAMGQGNLYFWFDSWNESATVQNEYSDLLFSLEFGIRSIYILQMAYLSEDSESAEFGYFLQRGKKCLFDQKDYSAAIRHFEQAIEHDPNVAIAWFYKGYALIMLKNYEESIKCFDKGLKEEPFEDSAWFNKGYSLIKLEKYSEASLCFNEALDINPKSEKAFFMKYLALIKSAMCQDRNFSSRPEFNRMINQCIAPIYEFKPQGIGMLFRKANFLNDLRNILFKEISDSEKLLQLEMIGWLPPIDYLYGCYDEITKLDPNNVEAWFRKGICFCSTYKSNKYELAISCYNTALKIDPKNYYVWYEKAIAQDKIGRKSGAIVSFKTFLDLSPGNMQNQVDYAKQRLKVLEAETKPNTKQHMEVLETERRANMIKVRQAIAKAKWLFFSDQRSLHFKIKVKSFKKIDLSKADDPEDFLDYMEDEKAKLTQDEGGSYWLMKIEAVNLSNKPIYTGQLTRVIGLVDEEGFQFNVDMNAYLSQYSPYGKKVGLSRFYEGDLKPKIEAKGAISFLLPDQDTEYSIINLDGTIKEL